MNQTTARRVTADEVLAALDSHIGDAVQRTLFVIDGGDTAWNPASTKHVIDGPARVTYTRHVDGGITAAVTD